MVVFSDLHFGEILEPYHPTRCSDVSFSDSLGEAENLPWGPEQDINSIRVMKEMIKTENPNFVVINGDLITGESTQRICVLVLECN